MLTRRYTPIIRVQAILVLKPPNNVKKLRHFLGILTWHVSKVWQNAGPSLNEVSVEKCQFAKQHLTMSMDHHERGSQFIQTSQSPSDIYVAPNMRTILLCKQGLPICEISGLPPRTHRGIPHMHTGIRFWCVSDLSASHALKQNFVHTRAHTHIKNHRCIILFR